jgi:hypothetical protein
LPSPEHPGPLFGGPLGRSGASKDEALGGAKRASEPRSASLHPVLPVQALHGSPVRENNAKPGREQGRPQLWGEQSEACPRASGFVPAARDASGVCSLLSPRRGNGAPKSATLWLASGEGRAAPLGAPWAAIYRAGPRFRRQCPASRSNTTVAFGIGQTVVSQLLAGPHNGHGRSPGAARVARPANEPRRRRTSSRHSRASRQRPSIVLGNPTQWRPLKQPCRAVAVRPANCALLI